MGKAVGQQIHNVVPELMKPVLLAIDKLVPDPSNARDHSVRNVDVIAASLKAFGQDQPLIVQKDSNVVRIGNGRLMAAIKLGWTHVACVVLDRATIDMLQRALVDNRSAELAEWNFPILAEQLKELHAESVVLDDLGWAEHEYLPLFEAKWKPPEEITAQMLDVTETPTLKVEPEDWAWIKKATSQRDQAMSPSAFVALIVKDWVQHQSDQ